MSRSEQRTASRVNWLLLPAELCRAEKHVHTLHLRVVASIRHHHRLALADLNNEAARHFTLQDLRCNVDEVIQLDDTCEGSLERLRWRLCLQQIPTSLCAPDAAFPSFRILRVPFDVPRHCLVDAQQADATQDERVPTVAR